MAGNAGLAYCACELYDETSEDFINDVLRANYDALTRVGEIAVAEFIFVLEDGAFIVDKDGELVRVHDEDNEALVIGSGRLRVHGFTTREEEIEAFNSWSSEEFYKTNLSNEEIKSLALMDEMTNNDWCSFQIN